MPFGKLFIQLFKSIESSRNCFLWLLMEFYMSSFDFYCHWLHQTPGEKKNSSHQSQGRKSNTKGANLPQRGHRQKERRTHSFFTGQYHFPMWIYIQSSIIHANIHTKVNGSTVSRMCNSTSLKPTSNSAALDSLRHVKRSSGFRCLIYEKLR